MDTLAKDPESGRGPGRRLRIGLLVLAAAIAVVSWLCLGDSQVTQSVDPGNSHAPRGAEVGRSTAAEIEPSSPIEREPASAIRDALRLSCALRGSAIPQALVVADASGRRIWEAAAPATSSLELPSELRPQGALVEVRVPYAGLRSIPLRAGTTVVDVPPPGDLTVTVKGLPDYCRSVANIVAKPLRDSYHYMGQSWSLSPWIGPLAQASGPVACMLANEMTYELRLAAPDGLMEADPVMVTVPGEGQLVCRMRKHIDIQFMGDAGVSGVCVLRSQELRRQSARYDVADSQALIPQSHILPGAYEIQAWGKDWVAEPGQHFVLGIDSPDRISVVCRARQEPTTQLVLTDGDGLLSEPVVAFYDMGNGVEEYPEWDRADGVGAASWDNGTLVIRGLTQRIQLHILASPSCQLITIDDPRTMDDRRIEVGGNSAITLQKAASFAEDLLKRGSVAGNITVQVAINSRSGTSWWPVKGWSLMATQGAEDARWQVGGGHGQMYRTRFKFGKEIYYITE